MSDPLRFIRASVRDGRYREAATALAALSVTEQEAPEAHLLAAMTTWRLGDFATSRAAALDARAGFRARGDADGEMRAENVAAAGAFGLGDLATAEEEWSRVREAARRLGDDLMAARSSNNLGTVALYLARTETADGFFRLARAEFERLGSAYSVAATWINAALNWRDVGRFAEGVQAADRALEAAEQAGSARLVGEALSTRGEGTAALGDPALGRTQVERALALARAEGDRLAEADALRNLAFIARLGGLPDEAEPLARQALTVAAGVKHPWSLAEIQRELGELFLATRRPADAAAAFRAAAEAFDGLGARPRAERMRARAREAKGA